MLTLKKRFKENFTKKFNILVSIIIFLQILTVSNKLIGVIQINRHGARTGEGFEDLSAKLYFGTKSKQLTITGISQHELLGHYIADKYIHNHEETGGKFLSKELKDYQIKIFSSSLQRAIFSGFGFVKGLYPLSKFKLNFIGKSNSTFPKNYTNIQSSDLITDISLPIPGFRLKREIPEAQFNILASDSDAIFHIKTCRIKIGEENQTSIYSNETIKELINDDNERLNYTDPTYISFDEIKNAVAEIKQKFPIALLTELLKKDKKPSKILKTELGFLEEYSNDDYDTIKFLKKVNAFLRLAEFHFGKNFIDLSEATQLTFNKIQVNKAFSLLLSESKYQRLLNSRLFDEFKSFLTEFLKNHWQNKKKSLKYVLYSGHDQNILGIIATFFEKNFLFEKFANLKNSYNFLQPELASHFIIELHNEKTEHFLNNNKSETFIRLIYNGQAIKQGLDKKFFDYNPRLQGYDLKNFLHFLDSQIDLQYKDLNCKSDGSDDDS